MLKKIISIALSVLSVVVLLCACTNADSDNKTTEQASQNVFYDAKGNAYDNRLDVLFYDEQGNTYRLEVVEDYMPDYVNVETGERLNGFQCYVTEQGYLYYDNDDKLSLKDGSMSIYTDANGNEYYDISTATWNSDGTLNHKY